MITCKDCGDDYDESWWLATVEKICATCLVAKS